MAAPRPAVQSPLVGHIPPVRWSVRASLVAMLAASTCPDVVTTQLVLDRGGAEATRSWSRFVRDLWVRSP